MVGDGHRPTLDGLIPSSLVEALETLEDPRVDRTKRHHLTDILVQSVLAVNCGADRFVAIALFGQLNEEWLRTFLALPHRIPPHDTPGRACARLHATRFEESFRDRVQNTLALTDGQSVRGFPAFGHGLALLRRQCLVLAQTVVDGKSNASPELLCRPCMEGCMVTLDAMGCQISIARQSRGQEADYVLHTRANHQGLRDCLKDTFALEQTRDCAGCRHDYADSVGKDHKGQIETHCCGDRVTTDTRCFISSLPPKAKPAGGVPALEHRKCPPLGSGCRLRRG